MAMTTSNSTSENALRGIMWTCYPAAIGQVKPATWT